MINIPYKRSYIIVLQMEVAVVYLQNNSSPKIGQVDRLHLVNLW